MHPAEFGLTVPPAESCFFLDFDGTLVDFAMTPDTIEVPGELVALLAALAERSGGALAMVTGRALEDLDHHLAPLRLPTAALHGTVRRNTAGQVSGGASAQDFISRTAGIRERLQHWSKTHPGLLFEDKALALAIHFRALPYAANVLHDLRQDLHRELEKVLPEGLELLRGDLVVEVRPQGADKGSAVEAFLAEAPFRGRSPVYLGDDLADLKGMAAVEQYGGLAIAVGSRLQAHWHLPSPTAARAWLAAYSRHGGTP